MTSYEQQMEVVHGLRSVQNQNDRQVNWCNEAESIGFALNSKQQIEIFLKGGPLTAQFRRVRNALENQTWYQSDGNEFRANRLVLPAAGHFEKVAALISTDLLNNGAEHDLETAFSQTEPLIDLAIGDLLLADETFLGLCGEMLVLRSLLREAPPADRPMVLRSWFGYRETPRDFQIGFTGIEVKATTTEASSHLFAGVHQTEVGHGVNGLEENTLFVCSVGLEWARHGAAVSTTSLPEMVEEVSHLVLGAGRSMTERDLVDFFRNVARYGNSREFGYDHHTMSEFSRFDRRFSVRFVRLYDMGDDTIRLITTDDLNQRPFIDSASLSFRINLPNRVNGDLNPVTGLSNATKAILAAV